MTYSTFGDVVSCSSQNSDKSDIVQQGCTARQVVFMRPAAASVSYSFAIKITHHFGLSDVPFITVFRARLAYRLTLSVMTVCRRRLNAPAVEGGKADNYNLRWLLWLPTGEGTVHGSFCVWVGHCGTAYLLQFVSKRNSIFLWMDYKGYVDECKVTVRWTVWMLLWLTYQLTDWLIEWLTK